MDRQRRHGGIVDANVPPARNGKETVVFHGQFQKKRASFGMTPDHLDKHTLLIGSTGCGKTTLLDRMIKQLQRDMSKDDVMIIFDSKGDFYSKFGQRPGSVLLGNSEQYYSASVQWNIFR